MHAVLDAMSDGMARTASYKRRAWHWLPADPTHPGWDGRCGTLTIHLQKGAGSGCKVESDTYAVEEEGEAPRGGRSFLLANETDPAGDEVYRCVVGGPDEHCACTAGKFRVYSGCKHRDALRAVLAAGGLADPIITGA